MIEKFIDLSTVLSDYPVCVEHDLPGPFIVGDVKAYLLDEEIPVSSFQVGEHTAIFPESGYWSHDKGMLRVVLYEAV